MFARLGFETQKEFIDLMRYIQGFWENWQIKLLFHYPLSQKSHDSLVKFPLIGKGET